MENAYGIGVKNRYELFYDEDVDPLEIIRQQEEEKEKRKSDKSHPKDKSKNIKLGKVLPATGLTKKTKESPVVNQTKPSENTETSNKPPRTRPFADRTARNPRNFDESKALEERKNFRNREDHGPTNTENRGDSEMRRGRGGFRGRGRGRGRGGFFNSFENRPPRREFDRHSGSDRTGLRSVEKRDGGGSNNWEDMKNEFNTRKKEPESTWMDEEFQTSRKQNESSTWGEIEEPKVTNLPKDEASDEKNDDPFNLNNDSNIPDCRSKVLMWERLNLSIRENQPVSEDRTEESTKEMTLDEWKREQEAKRAVPKYNLRKPGEGEDGNQWKRLYVLKKKAKEAGEEEDEEDEEEEEEDDDDLSRRGRQRQLVDIQINFNDSRRGRGRGRGVRGIGPRNERGSTGKRMEDAPHREERREPIVAPNVSARSYRGSMRMNKSGQQSAPKVDDWNDFPSLVTA